MRYSSVATMGFTHMQPAEPTTVGYRAAVWLQDLGAWYLELKHLTILGKGFKGAVGTYASYEDLLGSREAARSMEEEMSRRLDLSFWSTSGQTYPRTQDYRVISALAGLGAALHKVALDVRVLESPLSGELAAPKSEGQVGSSAMPHKRNPVVMERVCSLTRQLSVMPQVAWQNAAQSVLERTLDDSANRRSMLPEAFLICDEAVRSVRSYFESVRVDEGRCAELVRKYGMYSVAERVLTAAVKAGADRQVLHGRLMEACAAAAAGEGDLADLIAQQPSSWCLSREEVEAMTGPYLGSAPGLAWDVAVATRRVILDS
jgi:adenylosuccinate lyase